MNMKKIVDKEVHLYNDISQTPQLYVSGTLNCGMKDQVPGFAAYSDCIYFCFLIAPTRM